MDTYEFYAEHGYAIFKGAFGAAQIDEIRADADRLHQQGAKYSCTTEAEGLKWLVVSETGSGSVLRAVQEPYRVSPAIEATRTSPEVLEILRPLLGTNIKSVVNTLFWKPPNERRTAIAYHQDYAFRKPAENYRNFFDSYVQLGLALDPHGPANGGMRVVAGSHKKGDLAVQQKSSVLVDEPSVTVLQACGLSPDLERDIEMQPGDVAIWSPFLLHGSPANRSTTLNRRFLVTGYMRSVDCDSGAMAFADGHACQWRPAQ